MILTSPFSTFLIPLTNTPQTFNISLAGKAYTFTSKWNASQDAGWVLDILDADTNAPLVCNVPMITGADLLEGLDYLGINGQLIAYTDGDSSSVPTLDNLGVNSQLYFGTNSTSG